MTEGKRPDGQPEWQNFKQRFLDMLCDLRQALCQLFSQFFSKPVPVHPRSIEQIAEERSRQIDRHILDKERSENLKFASGQFRIRWGSPRFTTLLVLYYQTSEGKWLEEKSKYDMPVESLTEESRQRLEKQKELTYPINPPEQQGGES